MGFWRTRCPEVVLISSLTGRTRHEVLGWLCDFWSWCSSESTDGQIRGVKVTDLPSVIGADSRFWSAVVQANWLAEDDFGLVVPGWDHWLCESAKKRARERVKKRNQRSRPRPKPVPQSVPKVSPKCPPETGTTEQNRREEKKEEEPPLPPATAGGGPDPPGGAAAAKPVAALPPESVPVPPGLDTPAFRAAWSRYVGHRGRMPKAKRMTANAAELVLQKLTAYGPEAAADLADRAVMNGWQGIVFDQTPPPRAAGPPGTAAMRPDEFVRKYSGGAAGGPT